MPRFPLVSSAVVAASLGLAVPSFAQGKDAGGAVKDAGAAAMAALQPSKELEAWMKPIDGSWKCDTKMMAGAMGPNSPESTGKTTVKFSKDKDTGGMWHRGEYAQQAVKGQPQMKGYFLLGYDETAKQLKSVSWDNLGGASFGTGTMTADTMIWTSEGVMMGQKMKTRDTMTKTGPKSATHKMEADTGKGFQLMGEDTCTR